MLVAVTGTSPQSGWIRRRSMTFAWLHHSAEALGMPFMIARPVANDWSRTKDILGWARIDANVPESPAWAHRIHRLSESNGPVVVYDAMYLTDLSRYHRPFRHFIKALHSAEIPVFNPTLPAKDKLMRLLQPLLQGASTPYSQVNIQIHEVIRWLDDQPAVWLKPTRGSGGRDMLYICRSGGEQYLVQAASLLGHPLAMEYNQRQLRGFLQTVFDRKSYIGQRHITLPQTSDRRTGDFRVTLARGQDGQWTVIAITGRLSAPNQLWTNYHAGGEVTSLTRGGATAQNWLKQLQLTRHDVERAQLAALEVAKQLTSLYPRIGILGLDFGLGDDGNMYFYDCNARPGRDILEDAEIQHLMGQIAGFAYYLLYVSPDQLQR